MDQSSSDYLVHSKHEPINLPFKLKIDSFKDNIIPLKDYILGTQELLLRQTKLISDLCIIIQEYGVINLWLLPEDLIVDMILVNKFSRNLFNYDYLQLMEVDEENFPRQPKFLNSILSELFLTSCNFLLEASLKGANISADADVNNSNVDANVNNEPNYDIDQKDVRNEDIQDSPINDENEDSPRAPVARDPSKKDLAIFNSLKIIGYVLDYFRKDMILNSNCSSIAIIKCITEQDKTYYKHNFKPNTIVERSSGNNINVKLEKCIINCDKASYYYGEEHRHMRYGTMYSGGKRKYTMYKSFNVGMFLSIIPKTYAYNMGRWLMFNDGNLIPLIYFYNDDIKLPCIVHWD